VRVELTVNGDSMTAEIESRELLLDFLRDRLHLTGAKRSCEVGVCGTCTVLVDGQPVSACMYLVHEASGREVLTIEGFAAQTEFSEFEQAFTRHAALQCGFCTPGMVLTLKALRDAGDRGDAYLREELAGNICRCTGYEAILAAARDLMTVEPPARGR
jgi:aerobic-type carbon monoxide dehydrogenase small subunit (CoxS/CutS family)